MCYSCYSAAAPSASTRNSNLGAQILAASCRALEIPCCHSSAVAPRGIAPVAAATAVASADSSCSFKTPQVPPLLLHSCSSVLQAAACKSLLPCVSHCKQNLRWQQLVLLTILTSLPSFHVL